MFLCGCGDCQIPWASTNENGKGFAVERQVHDTVKEKQTTTMGTEGYPIVPFMTMIEPFGV